eukprot:1824700-Prymnesium_polylepis.2
MFEEARIRFEQGGWCRDVEAALLGSVRLKPALPLTARTLRRRAALSHESRAARTPSSCGAHEGTEEPLRKRRARCGGRAARGVRAA